MTRLLIHTCDMTRSAIWHDSLLIICVSTARCWLYVWAQHVADYTCVWLELYTRIYIIVTHVISFSSTSLMTWLVQTGSARVCQSRFQQALGRHQSQICADLSPCCQHGERSFWSHAQLPRQNRGHLCQQNLRQDTPRAKVFYVGTWHIHICVRYVYIYICVSMKIYEYICIYIYVYITTCMNVCICVYICTDIHMNM